MVSVPKLIQPLVQSSGAESVASFSLRSDSFLEQLLETIRSLKETQERQGEKIEALINSQINSQRNIAGNLSAEDALKKLITAARIL